MIKLKDLITEGKGSEDKASFDKKVKKFNKIYDAAWNSSGKKGYVKLTNTFWKRWGYRIEDLLDDFYDNYPNLWLAYRKKKGKASGFPSVDDLFV